MQSLFAYATFFAAMMIAVPNQNHRPKQGLLFWDQEALNAFTMRGAIDEVNATWAANGEKNRLLSGKITYRTANNWEVVSAYGEFTVLCGNGVTVPVRTVFSGHPEVTDSMREQMWKSGFKVMPANAAFATIRKRWEAQMALSSVVEKLLIDSCKEYPNSISASTAVSLWGLEGSMQFLITPVTTARLAELR